MNTQTLEMINDLESEAISGGGILACEAAQPLLDFTQDLYGKLFAAAGLSDLCAGDLGKLFCRDHAQHG